MELAPIPVNEIERLRALYALEILDTKPDELFDRVTRIARELFDVLITAISFVDKDRIWFKSIQGLEGSEISRCTSFCGHSICLKTTDNLDSRILEISDTQQDSRFSDNPLVIGEPGIRYYMGFVLQSGTGENLGTLCLLDTHARNSSEQERKLLVDLSLMIQGRLNEMTVSTITSNFNFEDVAIVSKIAQNVFDEMNALLKKRGICIGEWRVLDKVAQSDFATPSKICQQIGISPQKLSRVLEILEAKGLISRRYNVNEDRRKIKLECNELGQELWRYGKMVSDRVVNQLREK